VQHKPQAFGYKIKPHYKKTNDPGMINHEPIARAGKIALKRTSGYIRYGLHA
jgi:hypothetical protein